MSSTAASRVWLWTAVALTAAKLWLTSGQTVYAIGPAFHDDQLFISLTAHLLNGDWLGPYNQFTLAKGPMFPLFLAGVFWIGLPLIVAQQLVYAGASAVVTRAQRPWFPSAGAQFALYTLLLANPMSWDAGNLGRLMRQNLYTPLALLVIAGLAGLFHRRTESWRRQAGPAALAGTSLGCFWLTREESVWLLPAVGLLLFGIVAALGREVLARWRPLAAGLGVFLGAALLPALIVCSLNYRHYGWFGTVEFRAADFKDAYGALTRLQVGPALPHQVPVTRQMREAAYEVSPAFARLRSQLEGPVGDHWSEKQLFPAGERQIRGGWFVWAIRDAMVAAGHAPDAAAAMRHYRLIADEINAACDAGRVPARPRRSGFVPPLSRQDLGPLSDGAVEYGSYFLFFRGFTARAPNSVGDYAELKPFRDLVGTKLSHAPRSPDPFPANQGALASSRVEWLDTLGLEVGRLFAWLGPLLLFAGLIRLAEAVFDRRPTFLLWLAGALLGACAAYLFINVLVHVTSFYNMSPAAMAAAYPLYLLALAAIAADAVTAWSQPVPATATAIGSGVRSRWPWLAPAGVTLFVFAARLREIHLYASDVPYNDQWIIEAQQILLPWLEGTLRPWTFFTPHFEHLPVWTRLLGWLQVAVTGRWDPLGQMTLNAALHALFVWLIARWLWRTFSTRAAGFVTAMLLLGGALPFAWENIAWGFQSQFPLALLCLFVHVHGSLTHAPGSRAWWVAQAAAVAGLFTLASMWVAPLAVVAALLWTGFRERRTLTVPALVAGCGLALFAFIHWRVAGGAGPVQGDRSPLDWLHAGIFLLGWPGALPGAAVIVQLPWLIHAWRLRGRMDAAPADRLIFALGLWNCAHAIGLAVARSGDAGGFVSRYGDLLFVGVLTGALALTRLVPAPGRGRWPFMAGATVWLAVVTTGIFENATEGHARYFHQTAAHNTELRRTAVQAYLLHGDRQPMEQPETRWVLTQSTDVLRQLLDRPDFRALLPVSVNPSAGDHALGSLNRRLQSGWLWLLLAGSAVLSAGLVAAWARPAEGLAPLAPASGGERWPGFIALGVACACTLGVLAWNNPFTFDADTRWRKVIGGADALSGLRFQFVSPTEFGPERLQGAAPLSPAALRNLFYGTAPAGPEWTGTVLSSDFPLDQPWLVVPFAGYPTGHGNGLRLRILDAQGRWTGEEIGCSGPNQDTIAYWSVDVRAHQGRRAQLVLYDGRTATEGWIAVAPPIPTRNTELARDLAAGLARESYTRLHSSLAVIGLVAWAVAFASWRNRRTDRSS